jgi:FAD/FMN-containing dehydrogenase
MSNQYYQLVGILLILVGFGFLLIYLLKLNRQRHQIQYSLNALQEEGMQVFMKKYEKLLYSRDVGDIPKIMSFLFNFNCLAIIQPKNIEETKNVIELCEKFKIPLIARGAGTSGYGGTLPIRNGIIVNLAFFNNIIALDRENQTVEVESGVTWEHLRRFLEAEGLTLKTYPSSAPSSTIGGWVAHGGYGVGSAKYGSIDNSVVNVTILGTNGKTHHIDVPDTIVGSCGSLGILWKITLSIQPISEVIHLALSSNSQDRLLKAFKAYGKLKPFFLRYDDYQNLHWKNTKVNRSSKSSHSDSGGLISMSFQEEDWDKRKIDEITNEYKLSELPQDIAIECWKDRFKTIKLKRKGPSLIIAEVLVPTNNLDPIIEKISNRFERHKFALEIFSASDDFSVVFVWFPVDLRSRSVPLIGSVTYTFHWLRLFDVIQIVRRWNGKPYSTGLWLSPYSGLILQQKLQKMKQFKKEIDPHGIFNPGKVWGTKIPRFFPIISWKIPIRLGVPVISFFYGLLPKKIR